MKPYNLKLHITIIFLLPCLLSPLTYAEEGARLIFTTKRIVLEDGKRSARLTLRNGGRKAATYRVSLSDVMYKNDGSVEHTNSPPPGFPSARSYIRFSPSQVRLNPGEAQAVRVLLVKQPPQNTEFRIHAVLKQLPEPPPPGQKPDDNLVSGGVSFQQASAIPVIVRVGETKAQAAIASARRTSKGVDLVLRRSGNRSLYTQLEVYVGQVAQANRIGLLKGFGLPVPNQQRPVSIPVNKPSGQPYIVVVKDQDTGEILAQQTVR